MKRAGVRWGFLLGSLALAGVASAIGVEVEGRVGKTKGNIGGASVCLDAVAGSGWTSADVGNVGRMPEKETHWLTGAAGFDVWGIAESGEGDLRITVRHDVFCPKQEIVHASEAGAETFRVDLGSAQSRGNCPPETLELRCATRGGRALPTEPALLPEPVDLRLGDGSWAQLVGNRLYLQKGNTIRPADEGTHSLRNGASVRVDRNGRVSGLLGRNGQPIGRVTPRGVIDALGKPIAPTELGRQLR